MARTDKRREAAVDRGLDVFAKYATQYGVTSVKKEEVKTVSPTDVREKMQAVDRDVDGLLHSLHKPHNMGPKQCRYCGEVFLTNYCFVSYCSHAHRVAALRTYGIEWDPMRHEYGEVWGRHEPPLVVRPETVSLMEHWARTFLADLDRVRQNQIPEQNLRSQYRPLVTPADLEEQQVLELQAEQVGPVLPLILEEEDDGPLSNHPESPLEPEFLTFDF